MTVIKQSVLGAWVRFSTPIEGETHNAYLDTFGNLTVGIGCLLEPPSRAAGLGWVFADGTLAPEAEVQAQLKALKAQPGLARYAFNSKAVLNATTIRLTDAGILALCDARLKEAEPWMVKYFPKFASWPADAQMCALSAAWSVGPGWPVKFTNCARVLNLDPPDFISAIVHMPDTAHPGMYLPAAIDINSTNNPGVVPRNRANELCLSNAAQVMTFKLDPEKLYWPSSPVFSDADPRKSSSEA